MKSRAWTLTFVAALGLAGSPVGVRAQETEPFSVEIEGGGLWQTRNDVRLPNQTGTDFSLADLIGTGPSGAFRAEVSLDVSERHGFRLVIAPLEIDSRGRLSEPTFFAGETFAPDVPTTGAYKFSSYRLTYRYRFHDGETWRWKLGLTAFVRDARIALTQAERFAEDTNVGFVPLLHLQGEARLSERLRFLLDFDGLAAPQGRAFDVAAKLGYRLSERADLALGYRTIEGGADVESVYNFAWLHFAVASVRLRF